nr:MAG TPA: hypothetical protein [Caudoviricetes sp.]
MLRKNKNVLKKLIKSVDKARNACYNIIKIKVKPKESRKSK